MIQLTRLNNKPIFINPDLIETIESSPDTLITLNTGNKISIKDSPEEIVRKSIEYKAQIIARSEELKQQSKIR